MQQPSKDAKKSIRRKRGRRFVFRMNSLVAGLLAVLLLAMLNYLSFRHYKRVDVNRSTFYQLADQTQKLLGSVSNDVNVLMVFSVTNLLFQDVDRLLEEYEYVSDKIQIEHVQPNVDLARARELKAQYSLQTESSVIFESEGRFEVVTQADLVDAEYDTIQVPMVPSATFFKGELMFSSAIKSVVHGTKPVVYVLQGHDEANFDDYDEVRGYSEIARAIQRENIDLRTLVLGERKSVPDDADGLIVAGPLKKISQPELDILRRYLDESGRMLVMLEPMNDAGLKPLLEDWGVQVVNDLVVDPQRMLEDRPEMMLVRDYEPHAITDPLRDVVTMFFLPRSVQPVADVPDAAGAADRPRVVSLVKSSDVGWADTDRQHKEIRFDPESDQPGPISIAVAVEKGPGPGIDVEIQSTRMVVIGDSDFVMNHYISGGNKDLMLGGLNWLLERDDLMGISPKAYESYRLVVSREQFWCLFGIVVGGIPGAVALLGLLVWAWRRA